MQDGAFVAPFFMSSRDTFPCVIPRLDRGIQVFFLLVIPRLDRGIQVNRALCASTDKIICVAARRLLMTWTPVSSPGVTRICITFLFLEKIRNKKLKYLSSLVVPELSLLCHPVARGPRKNECFCGVLVDHSAQRSSYLSSRGLTTGSRCILTPVRQHRQN